MKAGTIKICGHKYTVRDNPLEDALGHTNYPSRTIELDEGMNKEMREEVLIHEMLHVIIFHSNEKGSHNEASINAIANSLWQMGFKPPVK